MGKYSELGFEIGRLWNARTNLTSTVMGALTNISSRHLTYLAERGANISFKTIQKSATLDTGHVVRKAQQQ